MDDPGWNTIKANTTSSISTLAPTPLASGPAPDLFPPAEAGQERSEANKERLERQAAAQAAARSKRKREAGEGEEGASIKAPKKHHGLGTESGGVGGKVDPEAAAAAKRRGRKLGKRPNESEHSRLHRLTMRDLIHDNHSGLPTTAAIQRMAETKRKRRLAAQARAARRKARKEREAAWIAEHGEDVPFVDTLESEQEAAAATAPGEDAAPPPPSLTLVSGSGPGSGAPGLQPLPGDNGAQAGLTLPETNTSIQMIMVDGKMVVAPQSLTVSHAVSDPEAINTMQTVHENANSSKRSYQTRRISEKWSPAEVDLFYEALSQIGTDFGMIAKLFPKRTRRQIYSKFKKEERESRARIERTLRNPQPIDIQKFSMLSGIEIDLTDPEDPSTDPEDPSTDPDPSTDTDPDPSTEGTAPHNIGGLQLMSTTSTSSTSTSSTSTSSTSTSSTSTSTSSTSTSTSSTSTTTT